MELLFKQYATKKFLSAIKRAATSGLSRMTVSHTTDSYLCTVLEYVRQAGDDSQSADELLEILAEAVPEKREVIMNFGQQHKGYQRGYQEAMNFGQQHKGEQRGYQRGLQATYQEALSESVRAYAVERAKALLNAKFSLDLIEAATGLSREELEALDTPSGDD